MSIKSLLKPYITPGVLRAWHKSQAMLANIYYGFPGRRLRVIGVTGTNGKTTTCHLVGAIFQAAGYETAIASTVAFQIGDKREVNALNMTTPSPWTLQSFLARAVAAGAHMAVVETTSHAIDQERIWGIKYDGLVMTNITRDHLDYHKTMEAYRAAKLKLFDARPQVSIINNDDPAAPQFLSKPAYQHFTYGIDSKADITARKIMLESTGSLFTAVTPAGQIAINLALPGRFNIYNALAATGVAVAYGIGLDVIKRALESIDSVPGRMERIDIGQDFTALIDYAHTPDAFEKIYETLRPVTHGRLIHVFGATGDRDRTKRPIMGALAARMADLVVLTNEEPYTENPEKILDEIQSGLLRGRRPEQSPDGTRSNVNSIPITKRPSGEGTWWWRIPERREAIKFSLSLAKKGDVVLVTGMGDERFMTLSDGRGGLKKIPWQERRIVKDLLLSELKKTSEDVNNVS